ncbi:EAL domain-containing protein, partial [Vibrio parahaemolyticus]
FIHEQVSPEGALRAGSNPIGIKSSQMFEYEALSEASDLFVKQRTLSYFLYSIPIIFVIYLCLYALNKFIDPHRNLILDLKRAIKRGELTLYYQPQVNVDTGQLFGFEALVRWEHQSKGFISPDEFVPAAEQSGLVFLLTDFVLDKAAE